MIPGLMRPSEVTDVPWIVATGPRTRRSSPEVRPGGEDPTGKWLLFIPHPDVDEVWDRIRDATEAGQLGCSSKAATAYDSPLAVDADKHVICVYTEDLA